MSLRAEGRRFMQELRRNRRARQEAHQTISSIEGWWAGVVGGPLLGQAVTGRTRLAVEQQIDHHYNSAIAARVLSRSPSCCTGPLHEVTTPSLTNAARLRSTRGWAVPRTAPPHLGPGQPGHIGLHCPPCFVQTMSKRKGGAMARTVTKRKRQWKRSIHVSNSIAVARSKGGWAWMPSVVDMWGLPKRELVEVALRLGAVNAGHGDSVSAGRRAVLEELDALRENGIV